MSGHGRIVCSCGAVIAQCKCLENHKVLEVRPNACEACKKNPSSPPGQPLKFTTTND